MKHYQIVSAKALRSEQGVDYFEDVVLLKDLDTGILYSFVEDVGLRIKVDQKIIVQFQSDEVVA